MSASKTDPTDATSSIVAGCENFVVKPLDKDLLLRKVTTVLENINQKMHSTILHARAHKYKRLLEQTRKIKRERDEAVAAALAAQASDRSARAALKKEKAKAASTHQHPVRGSSGRRPSNSDAESPETSDLTPKISQR